MAGRKFQIGSVSLYIVKKDYPNLCMCGEVEDVVGALTPFGRGVTQVFHDILVELQLLLVTEVEEGEVEDRQEESWEVESGVQGEGVALMDGMWMTMSGVRTKLEFEPM